jgi:hypothetical protein
MHQETTTSRPEEKKSELSYVLLQETIHRSRTGSDPECEQYEHVCVWND